MLASEMSHSVLHAYLPTQKQVFHLLKSKFSIESPVDSQPGESKSCLEGHYLTSNSAGVPCVLIFLFLLGSSALKACDTCMSCQPAVRAVACREQYVEAQLAKRLGRTQDAADAAPLDAQQRAEQELYGVPENLKASGPTIWAWRHLLPAVMVAAFCSASMLHQPSELWLTHRPCTACLVQHAARPMAFREQHGSAPFARLVR